MWLSLEKWYTSGVTLVEKLLNRDIKAELSSFDYILESIEEFIL